MAVYSFQTGQYQGKYVFPRALKPETLATLSSVRDWMTTGADMPSLGRHALTRHVLDLEGQTRTVAIKSFSRASRAKDWYFQKNGSKARRSFEAALRLFEHGVGTPAPLAFLERWEDGRLLESYYLCEFVEQVTSFRDELNRLYREDPLCRRIMTLMETVALAIADLHDAGVCHRDLGNQNILLRRLDDNTWGDVIFIDLNRAHLADTLSLRQRARDVSRIDLPSDFLRVFKCMAFRHQHPPEEFQRWEARYRRRFARHTASRKFRHPIREARQRKRDALDPLTPRGRELWVWDDRSVQAVSTMARRERHAYYSSSNHFYVARGLLKYALPVLRNYRDYLERAFRQPVDMIHRVGVALGSEPVGNIQEQRLLEPLGKIPVLLRYYAHLSPAANQAIHDYALALKAGGHSIFAAFIQDRESLRNPRHWIQFVDRWLPALANVAEWVEVGHAVNRVKWGIWKMSEYRILMDPVLALAEKYPTLKLCGPAVIDFEYHYVPAFLDQVSRPGALGALSHHLYVDRRGAPENRQGKFSSLEKFALAKALAEASPAIQGDQLMVSEVNWPIVGTGEFSPVNSPYIIPGSHTNDPSVDEETYANYMIRYLALALCSGLVDRVYWWRLVARGFGLVDDRDSTWRERPALVALQTFLKRVGSATFEERLHTSAGAWALRFRDQSDRAIVLAWAHPNPVDFNPPFRFSTRLDRNGGEKNARTPVKLTGSPEYFFE